MYSVLYLDDIPQVRSAMKERLQMRGINVHACRNVYEADDVWDEHKDDLGRVPTI